MSQTRNEFELLTIAQDKFGGGQVRDAPFARQNESALFVVEKLGGFALYVEAPAAAAIGIEDETKAYRLEIAPTKALPSGRALMMRLTDDAFIEPFIGLIDNVAHESETSSLPLVDIVRLVAKKWRLAFKGKSAKLLTSEQQMSLIAELHLLQALAGVDRVDVLGGWHYGDEQTSRHDFEAAHAHVEVKATSSREEFVLSIHGLEQLTETDGVPLYLYAEQFEIAPEGETLPEAVDSTIAAGFSQPLLEAKLELAGYLPADAPEYETCFALRRSRARLVDGDLPRISKRYFPRQDLAEQLKRVSYQFDFGPIEGCVEDEMATSLMREAVRG